MLWFLSLDLIFEDSGGRDLPDALARNAAYAFGLIVFFWGPPSHQIELIAPCKGMYGRDPSRNALLTLFPPHPYNGSVKSVKEAAC